MKYHDATRTFHEQTLAHKGALSSLPLDWQRELAALWRLEADVNNGAYLQFLVNWGHESYLHASQALKKIGARKMAEIVDRCQSLVDRHYPSEGKTQEQLRSLLPNALFGRDGEAIKEAGSVLPRRVLDAIYKLSYQFMDYPDDIASLGMEHYRALLEGDDMTSLER